MALIIRKPITPGLRGRIDISYDDISTSTPEKSLTRPLFRKAGRGAGGRISVRHRGGGNKIKYRIIDFKRNKTDMPAKVLTIEYDPNRNARISLVKYQDGEKRYILTPFGLKIGDEIVSGDDVDIKTGNSLPLRFIPIGSMIHNVELTVGRGGQLGRSAGTFVILSAKEGDFGTIKLPSGEERLVNLQCRATLGQVSNPDAKNINYGKAGRKRHLGIRPTVRGIAMNPCDHPHGGGEGRSPIGKPGPVTPWGQPTLGYKTRHKKKYSNRFILARRP